ncbi:sulfur reduction protein DsrE [Marivirga lumbricoides]
MKTLIINSLIILSVLLSIQTQAQNTKTTDNYVVLSKKIAQLKPIILSAKALKSENEASFGQFVVVICGKEIGDITDREKMDGFIEMAKEANVQIVACGFSLSKFKVDPSQVPDEIKIVENGILYNFQLQKKGYYSLSL